MSSYQDLFRVRTVTCFLALTDADFDKDTATPVTEKIRKAADFLKASKAKLSGAGYMVQTVRIATNPFGKWLSDCNVDERLSLLEELLEQHGIQFCALGPAMTIAELQCCIKIVEKSAKFSCSANLLQNHVVMATQCAATVKSISVLGRGNNDAPPHIRGGLGNFRFCVAAAAQSHIPFFPVAKAEDGSFKFAVGLENGALANKLLSKCGSIGAVPETFRLEMTKALEPLQKLCQELEGTCQFAGIDTSLNPSLDDGGSVVRAIEALAEVQEFGGPGTLAAAATITQCLQSLPGIRRCGYAGLMLPLCEDQRLAEIASATEESKLPISQLLSISQVCGVGVDTVPIPGDCSQKELASLFLDVSGIAYRWNKSLSCRVFPVPDKKAGEWTTFDSPYMVNSRILPLAPICVSRLTDTDSETRMT